MHISSAFLLFPLALAAHLRISIPGSKALPNPSILPPSTSASLTTLSRTYTSPLRVDNTFDFRNLTTGSYLLDIHCLTHAFPPLRVDVSEGIRHEDNVQKEFSEINIWGTFRGNEWGNKGESISTSDLGNGVIGAETKAMGEKGYFVERAGFSPLSLLKNPMILIAGVSMIIVFGMPYLMDNMDPELRAEFEERQKSGSGLAALTGSGPAPSNPLQNFDAAAWLAGSSSSSGAAKKAEAPIEKGVPVEKGVSR